MLTFEPVGHRYEWGGSHVDSVTQIIASACGNPFDRVPVHVIERKRAIGQAVHYACELDDAGALDQASVHQEVLPYLEAWRAFRRELRFEVFLSERPLYHQTHGVAGTPDRGVTFLVDGDRAVIDLKTGLPGELAALQTAAYAELIDAEFGAGAKPLRRFALQALPNSRYKFPEYTNPSDWRDFLACLVVHRLKQRIAA